MTCEICQQQVPLTEVVDHLRIEHGVVEDFERWPDGGVVVHDLTGEIPEGWRHG